VQAVYFRAEVGDYVSGLKISSELKVQTVCFRAEGRENMFQS
jgi:hypothetical protein